MGTIFAFIAYYKIFFDLAGFSNQLTYQNSFQLPNNRFFFISLFSLGNLAFQVDKN